METKLLFEGLEPSFPFVLHLKNALHELEKEAILDMGLNLEDWEVEVQYLFGDFSPKSYNIIFTEFVNEMRYVWKDM